MADANAGQIFTDEDVRRLLAEERGEGDSQGGWSLASQSDNVEVWRKAEDGVPIHLLKASHRSLSCFCARARPRVCACIINVGMTIKQARMLLSMHCGARSIRTLTVFLPTLASRS